jgi:hypothetical protein
MEVQSSGAARAAVTTLITSAVAATDVLIVRMGVSSQLVHYARSTAGCSRNQDGCYRVSPPPHQRTPHARLNSRLVSQCPLLADFVAKVVDEKL